MKIKYKKLNTKAVIPTRCSTGAAGWDLTAVSVEYNHNTRTYIYDTGISVEIPKGYYGELKARSSVYKTGLHLANGSGTIDEDYRGSIKVVFYTAFSNLEDKPYKVGDRIAQLIIKKYENVEYVLSEDLSDTERGEGGFGSTDNNDGLSQAW